MHKGGTLKRFKWNLGQTPAFDKKKMKKKKKFRGWDAVEGASEYMHWKTEDYISKERETYEVENGTHSDKRVRLFDLFNLITKGCCMFEIVYVLR